MVIPIEFYNYLREQIKISNVVRQKVVLTQRGSEYVGICPFHSEKTPSFTVSDTKRFYHCFGCHAHGDIVHFVAKTMGIRYRDAAIKIAEEYAIALPKATFEKEDNDEKNEILNILQLASTYFSGQINKEVKDYLTSRGINKNIQEQFSIGYSPGKQLLINYLKKKSFSLENLIDSGLVGKKENGEIYEIFSNRIIFPIRNSYNKIVGFGGRVIKNTVPKYINSPETLVFKKSELLYGENTAINASYKNNYSIIVEGYMDVITLHTSGINEAVSSMGAFITEKHLQKLWRVSNEIIICLDNDNAGCKASYRIIDMVIPMLTYNKSISFIKLTNYKDPDELIRHEGNEVFRRLIANRISLSEVIWLHEYKQKTFFSAESRAALEKKLENICSKINDRVLSNSFYRYFKNQIWLNLYSKKTATYHSKNNSITYIRNHNQGYNELEIIEQSLCSFVIKFPSLLKITKIKEFMLDLSLSSIDLNDFKEWFVNQVDIYDLIDKTKIKEVVEKSRFFSIFLVLSDPSKNFLDLAFIEKNEKQCELIFELLSKKYYLLSLKKEYISMLNSSDNIKKNKAKISFYLKEIQDTNKQLTKLIDFFTN